MKFTSDNISHRNHIQAIWRYLDSQLEKLVKEYTTELERTNEKLTEQLTQEIQKRQNVEAKLRTCVVRFNALVKHSCELLTLFDLDLRIFYHSPTLKRILGYSPIEFMGQRFWQAIHDDDRPTVKAIMERLLNNPGIPFSIEYRLRRQDGSWVWLEGVAINRLHEPNLKACVMVSRDISDRVQLQQAKDIAESANRTTSEFLANISHELRTPLNAISGFTQLLQNREILTPQQRNYLSIINQSSDHLLALINDILCLSKIEAGCMTLQVKSFDLYHLLDTIRQMFNLEATKKGLKLVFKWTDQVPQYIQADEKKIRQTLINLIDNAIKFTPEGEVTLTLEKCPQFPTLLFSIRDTGLGMAPEELGGLFKPFMQTKTGKNTQSGTGLGLAISQRFVQLMGGELQVQSVVNQGTTFTFSIPIQLASACEPLPQFSPKRVIGITYNQPKYRILIVDDSPSNRQLLIQLLTPVGFELQVAENGQQAVTIYEYWQPHLIWMDMRMPVMDGYQATQQIRAREGQRGRLNSTLATVIIAVTASTFEQERHRCLAVGCNDVVTKPFREDTIFAKMADYLGVRYRYEFTHPTPSSEGTTCPLLLTPEHLTVMPTEWIRRLHQAASSLDHELINQLIEQIPVSDASLADALALIVNEFRFDTLMNLTQPLYHD